MSEQRKAVIKNADMSDQMQQDAVDIASKALSEYSIEKVGHVEAFCTNIFSTFASHVISSVVFLFDAGCRGIY